MTTPRTRLAAATLAAALTVGCRSVSAEPARETGRDTEALTAECVEIARRTERINLNSGVYNETVQVASPLSIDIPVGVDGATLEDCLAVRNLAPERAQVVYAEREAYCQAQRQRRARVKLTAGGGTRLGDSDLAAYHACLKGEDAQIEVDVEFPEPETR